MRRFVVATAAWPPGLSQVQLSLSGRCLSAVRPIFRAQNKRPTTAFASFATRIVPYNLTERKFSAATGSNSSTETPNGSSSSEGGYNDDATVKTVRSGRWKWVGVLAIGLGVTIALSYDELERGEWQAGDLPGLLAKGWKDLFSGTESFFRRTYRDLIMPPADKLLPDQAMPQPVLVIGLEGCLAHTEWTREHGHRHMKRPGTEAFLTYLATMYEIVLWSSALQTYTDTLRQRIDPRNAVISSALYQEDMRYHKTGTFSGHHLKDLEFINRPLGRVVSIDTKPQSVGAQPSNAIIIKPWNGNPDDTELIDLIPLIEAIAVNDIQDVRPIIRHVTAHPHGVAAAYDELLKSAPGGARAKLPIRGARGGGVFSQFVVNPAPQAAAKEEDAQPPPPPEKPKPKRLITKL